MPDFTNLQNLDRETKAIFGVVAGGLALISLIVLIAVATGDDEGGGGSDAPAYLDEEGLQATRT